MHPVLPRGPAAVVLICAFALFLPACGGGGGGASGPDDGGVFDRQASVDTDGAVEIAGEAQLAIEAMHGYGDPLTLGPWSFSSGAGTSTTQFSPGAFAIGRFRELRQRANLAAAASQSCPGGGTMTDSWSDASASVVFDNCRYAAFLLNGRVDYTDMSIQLVEPVVSYSVTVTYTNFTLAVDGYPSERVNGRLTALGTENTDTGVFSGTLSGWITLKSGSGYVSMTTTEPVSGTWDSACPASGVLNVTGAGGILQVRYGAHASEGVVEVLLDGVSIHHFVNCGDYVSAT